jgi:hypothetical protein
VNGVDHLYKKMHVILMTVMGLVIVFYSAINVLLAFFIGRTQRQNQDAIFLALTSIPKNTVSSVVDKFKVTKGLLDDEKNSTSIDSDLNKQEQNIMKTFITAADASSSSGNANLPLIICTFLYIVSHIGMSVLLVNSYDRSLREINKETPHVDSFIGTMAYFFGSMESFLEYVGRSNTNRINPLIEGKYALLNSVIDRVLLARLYYIRSRYGPEDVSVLPFQAFARKVTEVSQQYQCSEYEIRHPSENEIYKCYEIEMLFDLVLDTIVYHSTLYNMNKMMISFRDEKIEGAWDIINNFVYERMFFPVYQTIVNDVHEQVIDQISNVTIGAYILLSFAFCVICVDLYFGFIKESEFRFTLKLLLHFPPTVLFQTPAVSQVLSGNFETESNLKLRDSEFFSKITEMLPEGLIIADIFGVIFSMNESSFKILNVSTKFETVHDFLQWDKFRGSAKSLLESTNGSVNGSLGVDGFVEISKRTIDNKVVFFLRNITMQVRCQNLIDEELGKSNKLLKTILPPSLVERFLVGERNISFSVPSATILFLVIVSFTPWC